MSADCKVICLCPSMGKSHGSFAWGESPKNVLVTWTIVPDGMQKILEHLEPSTKWYRSCLLYPHLNDLNDSKIYLRVELSLVSSWNGGFARIETTTWLETWFHSAGEARPVVSRFSPLMWPQDRKLIDRYRQMLFVSSCAHNWWINRKTPSLGAKNQGVGSESAQGAADKAPVLGGVVDLQPDPVN